MFKPKMYPKIKMPLTFELLQIFCPTEVTNNPEIQKQKERVRVEDKAMKTYIQLLLILIDSIFANSSTH